MRHHVRPGQHVIGRHVHAKARPDDTTPPEPVRTGIDYLHLVEQQHAAELAERVQYAQLRDEDPLAESVPDRHVAGQLPLPGTGPDDAVPDNAVTDDSAGESEPSEVSP